jgi:hypothetical protein
MTEAPQVAGQVLLAARDRHPFSATNFRVRESKKAQNIKYASRLLNIVEKSCTSPGPGYIFNRTLWSPTPNGFFKRLQPCTLTPEAGYVCAQDQAQNSTVRGCFPLDILYTHSKP